ncbi:hypothetical protein K492DRAFT_210381 [Lichtheimia hyalospora FSU 10163]|nr:hypothetical protein K492DRAFT_210381 [Lichtheimia hyalospora FSU 10163]
MTGTSYYQPIVRLPKSNRSSMRPNSIRRESLLQIPSSNSSLDTLVSSTLRFSGLGGTITEEALASVLQAYDPTEVVIHEDGDSGYLRFANADIADRVYSLYNGFGFENNGGKLQFHLDDTYDPEPKGPILEVKNLPLDIDNDGLYDLFRGFGPLSLCKLIVNGKAFQGAAFVQYFSQDDSNEAQNILNGRLMGDNSLVIVPFSPLPVQTQKKSPIPQASGSSKTESGYVDYMNLYIKNLEPHINNDALFQLFKKFGKIVSARVMSNPATGQSKGYGFVSYDKAEEAAAALQEMNGKIPPHGVKPLIVAYHEPKKPRQEKQGQSRIGMTPASNFSSSGGIRTPSIPVSRPIPDYINNHAPAPSSTFDPNMSFTASTYDINAQQARTSRPTQMNGLGIDNVDQIAINMKPKRPSPPHSVHRKLSAADSSIAQPFLRLSPPFSSSPMSGASSNGPSLISSLASGANIQPRPYPHHHHHQQQQQQSMEPSNGRPTLRRRGSLESVSSVMTESSATMQRKRLAEAVMRCGDYSQMVNDIVDMLLTLKRKERSLCLFNQDFLREKIELALIALDTFNDEEEEEEEGEGEQEQQENTQNVQVEKPEQNVPTMARPTAPARMSKAIPIVAPPPEPKTPISPSTPTTNKTSTNSSSNTSDQVDVDEILQSLEGKPIHEKKQQLGDRLFPLVKATGTKQAPKVTIKLLDSIDLYELAHLMYDKKKLKERVDIAFASLK